MTNADSWLMSQSTASAISSAVPKRFVRLRAIFTEAGVEAALASFWPAFDFLVSRRVDRIVKRRIPVSAFAGRERILGFLEEAARREPTIPTSADFEEAIEGFKLLGYRKIAMAGKWDDELMGRVAAYLRGDVRGNDHMMMLEKNSSEVAGVLMTWLEGKGL